MDLCWTKAVLLSREGRRLHPTSLNLLVWKYGRAARILGRSSAYAVRTQRAMKVLARKKARQGEGDGACSFSRLLARRGVLDTLAIALNLRSRTVDRARLSN